MKWVQKLRILKTECHENDTMFIYVFFKGLYFKWLGVNLLANSKTIIKGLKNIETSKNTLKIGLHNVGITHIKDYTFLNIQGKLILRGKYTITSGCRIYIGKGAIVDIGDGGYVNAFTKFIIMHGMKIGSDSVISWNCQFLDEDYHVLEYENKNTHHNIITIGNHVWIGCNSFIYKGVTIADGCMIAANSVVRNSFEEPNCLIAGNPATVVKRNIGWH